MKQRLHQVYVLLRQGMHRTFVTLVLSSVRFLMHLWIRNRKKKEPSKRRKKDLQTMKVMGVLEELLANTDQLNNDRTEGSNPVYTRAGKHIIDAFVSQRHRQQKNDYYIFVAEAWVEELERNELRTLLIWVVLLSGIFMGIVTFIQLWILLEAWDLE